MDDEWRPFSPYVLTDTLASNSEKSIMDDERRPFSPYVLTDTLASNSRSLMYVMLYHLDRHGV